jgi:NAD(P)-dependent dehydrogenase (short-subunit alcohol dehydrogenase family)
MNLGVTGKVVIVTGAAQGIGEATARRFAQEGARLVLSDLTVEVTEVAAGIARDYPSSMAFGIVTNVTDPKACDELVATTIQRQGALDALMIATATLQKKGPLVELQPEEWDRVMAMNAKGPFLLCRSAISALPRPGGAIVVVASFAGQLGAAEYCAYSASKGAITAFTRSLAVELAAEGIRVNAVAPAYVASVLGQQVIKTMAAESGRSLQEIRAERDARVPLRRQAAALEVANAMLFLASPAASYITGACLDVNGGLLMR